MEFHHSPWAEFLGSVARGESYDLEWQEGFGAVVLIAVPPFPFHQNVKSIRPLPRGIKINFREEMTKEEMKQLQLDEAAIHYDERAQKSFHVCSDSGYVMHVSAIGKTVREAQETVYRRISKIVIPKMFYRTDIGVGFL